ncbi:MAG: hypothetical protein J0L84_04310 [Verrucomicrobia bacterium]|nr:hypothetical protein [Verrucomicrobiota bacterium]
MKRYDAPWSPLLRWVSGLVTLLCVGLGVVLLLSGPPMARKLWMLPPAILVCCAPFTIRGYALAGGVLEIERLFWTTRIPLRGLTSAAVVPNAMRGSVRTLGNGGLFSFSGWYWSRALGVHRAWVTDLRHTVVLRLDSRTLVISPSPAEEFVRQIRAVSR